MNALEIMGLITCGVVSVAVIYVLVQAVIVVRLVNQRKKGKFKQENQKENGNGRG